MNVGRRGQTIDPAEKGDRPAKPEFFTAFPKLLLMYPILAELPTE
jgi:hypothetical protein